MYNHFQYYHFLNIPISHDNDIDSFLACFPCQKGVMKNLSMHLAHLNFEGSYADS